MSYSALLLALILITSIIGQASASGRSVEDLIGVFSIEKTIKLGSSSACFNNAGLSDSQKDPLGMGSNPLANPLADDQSADLAGFGLEPNMLKGSSKPINLTAHIIDDDSGLGSARVFFRSPTGAQIAEAIFAPEARVSGTSKDGIYTAKMSLPKKTERGAWLLDNFTLSDAGGNSKVLSRSDMVRMNLPAEFIVT